MRRALKPRMDSPEYLADQLAIAEHRIQETSGEDRAWWKRRLAELERRAQRLKPASGPPQTCAGSDSHSSAGAEPARAKRHRPGP